MKGRDEQRNREGVRGKKESNLVPKMYNTNLNTAKPSGLECIYAFCSYGKSTLGVLGVLGVLGPRWTHLRRI